MPTKRPIFPWKPVGCIEGEGWGLKGDETGGIEGGSTVVISGQVLGLQGDETGV